MAARNPYMNGYMNVKKWLFPLTLLLGANTGFAQSSLTRQQAIADIDYYIHTMEASHYAPFTHISQKDYHAGVEKIKRTLGDSISARDLIMVFFRITALLGDAHSAPQPGQPFLSLHAVVSLLPFSEGHTTAFCIKL